MSTSLDMLQSLISKARAHGADHADALLVAGTSMAVQVRNNVIEDLERSEAHDVGLRVFVGKKTAIVSATNPTPDQFDTLAERAVAMARVVPEDQWIGLCEEAEQQFVDATDMDLCDTSELQIQELTARARESEKAALEVKGVTNSIGASAGFSRRHIALVTSAGFSGEYTRTSHSVSASVLAGADTAMQRDYDYHQAVHLEDLRPAAEIGKSAGARAVSRLHSMKPKTGVMPVVYDSRVSGSLLGHLASALNGAAIARGTSFLKECLGKKIFQDHIHIVDDPRRKRGLASFSFDGEGVIAQQLHLVRDGVLDSWLLDSRSARQLGLKSNGRAARGPSSAPSPSSSNLFLMRGNDSVEALISDIKEGVYITELMGSAVNLLTGDYSRGASGFMIRDGKLAEPVSEFTIAGNLKDMFLQLSPANDLEFKFGTDSPTVRIDAMTVAGS